MDDVDKIIAEQTDNEKQSGVGEQGAFAVGGEVEDAGVEHDEDGCCAKVALDEEQEKSDASEEEGWENERENLPAAWGFIGEVGGEVDDEEQLERLGGLEVDAAKSQPETGTYAKRI